MTQANSINAVSTGIQTFNGTATFSGSTVTQYGVLVGGASNAVASTAVGSAGQVLQSSGAGVNPAYSTATYPATAGSSGNVLTSDGTNWTSAAPSGGATAVTSAAVITDNAIVRGDGGARGVQTSVPTIDDTGNLAIAASVSGATLSSTVSNTSNTASSNALQQVTVAGTSAGDAFTTYTVSGTTNWSLGTDNSVTGDPFVIAASTALGTTNIMSAATTGEINYPLQPAFAAYLSSSQANKTGTGTTYTVICDTERFDQNGDYNNATGVFTAPVTGRYMMCAVGLLDGCSVNTGIVVQLDSSNQLYLSETYRPASNINSGGTLELLIDMDAADTCAFKLQGNGEVGDTDDVTGGFNNFTGYLAC